MLPTLAFLGPSDKHGEACDGCVFVGTSSAWDWDGMWWVHILDEDTLVTLLFQQPNDPSWHTQLWLLAPGAFADGHATQPWHLSLERDWDDDEYVVAEATYRHSRLMAARTDPRFTVPEEGGEARYPCGHEGWRDDCYCFDIG